MNVPIKIFRNAEHTNNSYNINYNNTASTSSEFYSNTLITYCHVTYVVLLIMGLGMNLTSFASILPHRPILHSIYLYTLNLVVCDILLLLVVIPTQMVLVKDQLDWKMGLSLCKAVNTAVPVLLCCSMATLLAIAFDRLQGLTEPVQETWRSSSLNLAKISIPIIWITSLVVNTPLWVHLRTDMLGSVRICTTGWGDVNREELFWLILFVFEYAIPLTTLFVVYILTIVVIMRNRATIQKGSVEVIKIAACLVIVFSICTGYQHVFFLITSSFVNLKMPTKMAAILFILSNIFLVMQASLKPLLYGYIHGNVFGIKGKRKLLNIINSITSWTRGSFRNVCSRGSAYKCILPSKARWRHSQKIHCSEAALERKRKYDFQNRFKVVENYYDDGTMYLTVEKVPERKVERVFCNGYVMECRHFVLETGL